MKTKGSIERKIIKKLEKYYNNLDECPPEFNKFNTKVSTDMGIRVWKNTVKDIISMLSSYRNRTERTNAWKYFSKYIDYIWTV